MSGDDDAGREQCSDVRCEEPANAIYSNGVFVEPRCEDHATGDHLTVVRSLNTGNERNRLTDGGVDAAPTTTDHHDLDDVLDELDAHAAERGMPLGEYLLLCSRIFESTELDEDFLETALGGRR